VVVRGQIVLSPLFMGAEPIRAATGKYAGLRVLEREETAGFLFAQSLNSTQRKSAVVGPAPPADVFAGAFADNVDFPAAGIRFGELSAQQQTLLRAVIEVYLDRLPAAHADARRGEIETRIADTSFCWMGGLGENDPFYYRIFNPLLLIEFGHLSGLVFDSPQPTRNHIHTVVRAPNGNDYGKAILRDYRRRRGG
jgi:hypothetical protein